jgi:hypothetical protein
MWDMGQLTDAPTKLMQLQLLLIKLHHLTNTIHRCPQPFPPMQNCNASMQLIMPSFACIAGGISLVPMDLHRVHPLESSMDIPGSIRAHEHRN